MAEEKGDTKKEGAERQRKDEEEGALSIQVKEEADIKRERMRKREHSPCKSLSKSPIARQMVTFLVTSSQLPLVATCHPVHAATLLNALGIYL